MFENREEAALKLSQQLDDYRNGGNVLIGAIPRGGVVIGKIMSRELMAPLTVIPVKKVSAPNNAELAIGAISSDNVKVIDWELALRTGVEQEYFDEEIEKKKNAVKDWEQKFGTKRFINYYLTKDIFIIVDDGVATGATVKAAVAYVKKKATPEAGILSDDIKIILAVPVIAKDTYRELQKDVDRIVALEIPDSFRAVGEYYQEFRQITDDEVVKLMSAKEN